MCGNGFTQSSNLARYRKMHVPPPPKQLDNNEESSAPQSLSVD